MNYVLIVLGAFLTIYGSAGKETNTYILILGIVILMIGIYRISRNIPSKHDEEVNNDESEFD